MNQPLLIARVTPEAVQETRAALRARITGIVLGILAVTLIVSIAPLLRWREVYRLLRSHLRAAAIIFGMLVAARLLLWFAPTDRWTDQVFHLAALDRGLRALLRTPIDFLLTMAAAAAALVLAFDLIERLRRIVRHRQSPPPMRRDWFAFSATQLAAGAVVALLLVGYEVLLGNAISATSVDALHFSLHPLSAARLAFASGLVLAQAVVFWAGVLGVVLITVPWRTPRTGAYRDGGLSAAGSTGPVDCDFSAHDWRRALHRAGVFRRRLRVSPASRSHGACGGRGRDIAMPLRRCGSSPELSCF